MRKPTLIRAGESLPFTFDRGVNSIVGWNCVITVKQKLADSVSLFGVNRQIVAENGAWPGYLTQTETSGLAAGWDYLLAKLTNTDTDEEELIDVRFSVSTAWV